MGIPRFVPKCGSKIRVMNYELRKKMRRSGLLRALPVLGGGFGNSRSLVFAKRTHLFQARQTRAHGVVFHVRVRFIAQRVARAVLCWLACAGLALGQTLNLPPRASNALGGQQFVNVITPMSAPPDAQRENWIYAQVASGNIPDWMRTLCLVTTNAVTWPSARPMIIFWNR